MSGPSPTPMGALARTVERVLRFGSGLAIVLMAAGILWLLAAGDQPGVEHFAVRPASLAHLDELLSADGLLNAGILVLVAVPVVCVAIGAVWYFRRRIWIYALMTVGALLILALAVLNSS